MIYFRRMPEGLSREEQTEFARTLLFDAVNREYEIQEKLTINVTEKGKPYFADKPEICFNYSHSKGAAVCAVADQEIGIDLEMVRPFREKTAEKFCCRQEWEWLRAQADQERAWIRLWTGKEAYLKWKGTGLVRELDQINTLMTDRDGVCHIRSSELENYQITVCSLWKWDGEICLI